MMENIHAAAVIPSEEADKDLLITHRSSQRPSDFDIEAYKQRLRDTPAASLALPLKTELDLLNQMMQFPFGRFLLGNRGINGYWTSQIVLPDPHKEGTHPLENWLLHEAPAALAHKERFNIAQRKTQEYMYPGIVMASIPCGLMDDLLRLNYSQTPNVCLVGIDLDQDSLDLAEAQARTKKWDIPPKFHNKNAWDLKIVEEFDLITSSGLNMYEESDQKVIALYQEFFRALRHGGILLLSFTTPPSTHSYNEKTLSDEIPDNHDDLMKQRAIFADILQAKWLTFRTEEQTRAQLEAAGFAILEVIYDRYRTFPTVIAKKQ